MLYTSSVQDDLHRRVGIGSYAFRYAIGGEPGPIAMDLRSFMTAAVELEFRGVQLCENLAYERSSATELAWLSDFARDNGLFLELGMRDLSWDALSRHLQLAEHLGAGMVRIVLGPPSAFPARDDEELVRTGIATLDKALPRLETTGIRIGIENHFDLTTPRLVEIVETVDHPQVGYVFDTTNGIGFVERPTETLTRFAARLFSVHVKDYEMEKVEAGYTMNGCALGEGLLDLDSVIETIASSPHGPSVILEMTIRREKCDGPDLVQWEREHIMMSARTLRESINDHTHTIGRRS